MKILLVYHGSIPVTLYGGIERVICSLGKALYEMGHEVNFLVKDGSTSQFGKVYSIDTSQSIVKQIPPNIDLVHFHFEPDGLEEMKVPYLITMHGNATDPSISFNKNTVFLSKDHAMRHGSKVFVHNGLDWTDYGTPDLNVNKKHFHFLGRAAWRLKNVKGAIDVIKKTSSEKLHVLGGYRFNVKMGLRFTFSPRIRFHGMVGGSKKNRLLNYSKGLIFPVRWHEPFGLAIIESLYFGCPVFGTPYGSLPELVHNEVGFLSSKSETLSEALVSCEFDKKRCHEYALDNFNNHEMARSYLPLYDLVLNQKYLNPTHPQLQEKIKSRFLDWE